MAQVEVHRTVVEGADLTVVAQFAAYRHLRRAGFYAVVHGQATKWQPVVIATEDLRPGDRWEFRTSGLWAEQVNEHPTATEQHWSYGLEAFALRLDDPAELLGRGYGDRCALGWELDVFVPIEPLVLSPKRGHGSGIVLYEDLELEIDGEATRWEWSLDSDDLSAADHRDLRQTVVGFDQQPEGLPQPNGLPVTVIVPTLIGEWSVAIADRPTSG